MASGIVICLPRARGRGNSTVGAQSELGKRKGAPLRNLLRCYTDAMNFLASDGG